MNRPILVIVIGYIIGIIWGLYFKISIVSFYTFLCLIYIIINLHYKKKKFKIFSTKRYFRYLKLVFKINVLLCLIISSFISSNLVKDYNQKYDSFKNGQTIEDMGIIVSNKVNEKYKIKINNIYFYISGSKDEFEYGDKVSIKGIFQEPSVQRNYKGFNYKQYLKTLKICGTIKISKIQLIDKNCGNKFNIIANKISIKAKENIEKTYSKETFGLIEGMILGNKENIDESIKEQFSKSGISHILAISGMHITYIIYLTQTSTKGLFGKKKSKIITALVLIIYTFITGFQISILRACIMGSLELMSFVFYRKNNTLNSIAISALIILIYNPFYLINTAFILTYIGTIGIILLRKNIRRILKSIKIKNRKWKYVFLRIQKKCSNLIEIISVSIAVQLSILPITISNFNKIGITFLITNILITLIAGIIIIGGILQLIISFIHLGFATFLAKIISIPVKMLILISKIGGTLNVVTPDLYQILIYYIILIVINFLYHIFNKRKPNQTEIRLKNIIYLLKYKMKPYKIKIKIVLICFFLVFLLIHFTPSDLKIYFVDVGQGDCSLIVTPLKQTVLIDGGGSTTYDVGKNILTPYLLNRKISKIDYIIISHFDEDHSQSYAKILPELTASRIFITEQIEENDLFKQIMAIAKEKNIKVTYVKAGDIINIDGVKFSILHPQKELITNNGMNNNSMVCKLEYKTFSMLFTGDIEKEAEELILSKNTNLKADVLKVAHHRFKNFNNGRIFESSIS